MSAQLEPRSWTEAQVREEARAAGFESVESALVSFLHGHGGRAGSLWAAFVSSRCRPAPPADAPPPSARRDGVARQVEVRLRAALPPPGQRLDERERAAVPDLVAPQVHRAKPQGAP